jgi:Ribbon-helix-helix protein, copG family
VTRKMTVYLNDALAARLDEAASQPGMSRTAVVEAALQAYLSAEIREHAAPSQRLVWMSRQLEQIERDLRIVSETVALHARYHLTLAPALAPPEQRAACALGQERFEAFAAQVGNRVHMGTPLMRETMERIGVEKPHLFTPGYERELSLGIPLSFPDILRSVSEPPAAATEGGSNGAFPTN